MNDAVVERLAVVATIVLLGIAAWATLTSPQRAGLECGKWPSPGWSMDDVEVLASTEDVIAGWENRASSGSGIRIVARQCLDALDQRRTITIAAVVGAVAVPFAVAVVWFAPTRRRKPTPHDDV